MKTWICCTRSLYMVVSLLTLSACFTDDSGDGTGAGLGGGLTISFTQPGNVTGLQTPDFVVNLVGTAESKTQIERVDWSNDRGGSGTANGTENWATGNIVLKVGVNNITITAKDVDGNENTKSIAVDRETSASPPPETTNAVAMYSYSRDLSNPAPVAGASIDARNVYFFVNPGKNWDSQGVDHIDILCCKGISGPGQGESYDGLTSVTDRPWVVMYDLSGYPAGGTRRIRNVGYFNDGSDSSAEVFDFQIAETLTSGNSAPVISGTPQTSVAAGNTYRFTPTATDADGDTLSFTIIRKPVWANFDPLTGTLSGTPGPQHVGTRNGITISVSDGRNSASLPSFSIVVAPSAAGSSTLTWQPPTEREDNTPLTDLAGFRIHYGQSPRDYSNSITVSNPGLSSYVVDNLSKGTWYFAVTAHDSDGVQSRWSNEGQTTIR